MALRSSFDPAKFIEQHKAHAIRCGYPDEAEDFAQFAFLQVWKYQHFQPFTWTWSRYLSQQFGNLRYESGRIKSLARRFGSNDDGLLEDGEASFIDTYIEAPEQEKEQKEKLTPEMSFFELLKKAPSKNSLRKLKKTLPLRTIEFRQMIEELEPLRITQLQW